jgi:hypothetical protein
MNSNEISFEDLAAGLRAWAKDDQINTAAVELLIWHETFLRRADFIGACVDLPDPDDEDEVDDGPWARIRWTDAQAFAGSSPRASTTELAVLQLAVAIGSNQFRLSGLGHAHKRASAQAFASACGLRLEPPVPEAGHSHPDFIPGDPATCHRCALEARDEGHALPGGWKEAGDGQ